MLPTKHTKEGVFNEKLALKKLLTYITSVYKIPQKSSAYRIKEKENQFRCLTLLCRCCSS